MCWFLQSSGTSAASTTQPQQPAPQIIQLQAQTQPQQSQPQAQQSQQTSSGGIQIIQQIIGPDGQIQQIPVSSLASYQFLLLIFSLWMQDMGQ